LPVILGILVLQTFTSNSQSPVLCETSVCNAPWTRKHPRNDELRRRYGRRIAGILGEGCRKGNSPMSGITSPALDSGILDLLKQHRQNSVFTASGDWDFASPEKKMASCPRAARHSGES